MNYTKLFYWLTVADGFKNALDIFSDIFTTLFILSGIAFIICFIGRSHVVSNYAAKTASKEEDKQNPDVRSWLLATNYFKGIFYTSLILSVVLWLAWALVPTKKDALLIVAGGSAMNFLSTDSSAKQLPHELSTYLVTEIKNMAKETNVKLNINDNKEKILNEAKNMTGAELIEKMKTDSTLKDIILQKSEE